MQDENPPRSGDTKVIAWMTASLEEFYYEAYRSRAGQCAIITLALELGGDRLREAAKNPTNRWLRNVAVYLGAVASDSLDSIRVPELRADAVVTVDILLGLEVQEPVKGDIELHRPNQDGVQGSLEGDVVEERGESGLSKEDHLTGMWLCPRAQRTLYDTILGSMRLWQRPPHDNCPRCDLFQKNNSRILALNNALHENPMETELNPAAELLKKAGGTMAARAELRKLEDTYQDLLRHMKWKAKQRAYLKVMESNLQPHQALLQLDYGGFTDSDNKKVSAWSATVVADGRETENFDFMFDAANQVTSRPGAKKDGKTGVFFLKELFGADRAPAGVKTSLFKARYPQVTELVFSGDTGNGYRAYEMLEYLSKFCGEQGYKVKLIPLAPGHAHNRTDGRIAHMNTLLNAVKKTSRVFGAEEIAAVFQLASDPKVVSKRKFMARSHVFFRVVVTDERDEDEGGPSGFGPTRHSQAEEGRLGVKSLLYFDFSVKGLDDDSSVSTPGYARVRVHADPELPDNKTFLFTWRKELWAEMCQSCSDLAVSNRNCPPHRATLILPHASHHAPRTSHLAPRTSRLPPHTSHLAVHHTYLPPLDSHLYCHVCRCAPFCSRSTGAPRPSAGKIKRGNGLLQEPLRSSRLRSPLAACSSFRHSSPGRVDPV
jgi:hypothetical protein